MRVGTSVRGFMGVPPQTWLKLANTLAFDHVEFYSSVFLEDPAKLIDKIGKKTTAIHLPYFDDDGWDLSSKHATEQFNQLTKYIAEYKQQLRVEWMIVHPPEDPDPDWMRFYERLEQFDTTILLENIKTQNFRVFAESYRRVKKRLGIQLGFCFDIVHSFLSNKDFLNVPKDLCSDIQYIHLNDTSSTEVDDHWPLGTGIIPLDHVFNFLKRIRFDGVINLEIKPRSTIDAISVVDSYLRILRKFNRRKYLQIKTRLMYLKPVLKRKLKRLGTI